VLLMLYLDFSEALVKCVHLAVFLAYLGLQQLYMCLILLGDIRNFQSNPSANIGHGLHEIYLVFILEER
jgi:hypothetical protein